jgi:hypothetical protein
MVFRTDLNNNPTAFTTEIAREAGLILGKDYSIGDSFTSGGRLYYTAKLIGDPIAITIKVIDKIGFYTVMPNMRWTYMALPYQLWLSLTHQQKAYTIGVMYQNEGGIAMKGLFPVKPI